MVGMTSSSSSFYMSTTITAVSLGSIATAPASRRRQQRCLVLRPNDPKHPRCRVALQAGSIGAGAPFVPIANRID
jgi:hypothetical protein